MTVVCSTNEGIYADYSECEPGMFYYQTKVDDGFYGFNCPLNKNDLNVIASEGGFFSYIAGTVSAILKRYDSNTAAFLDNGIKISNYNTSLPMKKGLSSSAAICVMVAKCFSQYYNLDMQLSDLMEVAYLGEMSTPSRCGRMDQCVAMGSETIGLMTFNGNKCNLRILHCNTSLHFVVADLKSSKDTVVILKELNACFPFPQDSIQALQHSPDNDSLILYPF